MKPRYAYLAALTLPWILSGMATAHGLRAPIINDHNAVVAKGDIPTPAKYEPVIQNYMQQIVQQLQQLNQLIGLIVQETQSGNLAAARQNYVLAHQSYERIRPVVALFGNVNQTINSHASDYLQGINDPRFVGFHRLEYDLFVLKDQAQSHNDALNLQYEIQDLHKRVALETIDIAKMIQASADFMEMILNTKLSGQENQFSQSDIADIAANTAGSAQIIQSLTPFIPPDRLKPMQDGFRQIEQILQKYPLSAQHYPTFAALGRQDHDKLYSLVTEQADQLAQLRAVLDVNVYYKYTH